VLISYNIIEKNAFRKLLYCLTQL